MLERPTNLDNSRAKPIVLAVGVAGHCLDIFVSSIFFFFSFSLSGTHPDID